MLSDLQHQLRLKARHEGNVAKGDRFALHQDENVLSAQALAKVSRHQLMKCEDIVPATSIDRMSRHCYTADIESV